MKENYNSTPEDESKMNDLLKEVGSILSKSSKTPKIEIGKKLLDNKNDFSINIEKGSTFELLVEAIKEELPDSGISITKETSDSNLPTEYVAIKITPVKTDRDFIYNLIQNPLYKVLDEPIINSPKGKELERQGLIPKDITDRLISKYYHHLINTSTSEGTKAVWLSKLSEEVGDVIPYPDEDLKKLLKKLIQNEYENKKL